jgi:glycosyltransferase involved in cell wall biosynthesis
MKILQIAPLWETVPPTGYGGTEAVAHLLVEELVKRGHEVTLCASGDSTTSARLQSFYPRSLRKLEGFQNKSPLSVRHCALSLASARDYDIVHNHAGEEVMSMHHLVPDVPMLTTMHCLIAPEVRPTWDDYRGYYNTISWSQRRTMPDIGCAKFAGVAYNAIDVASFPFREEKGDYLLFLARISPEKGPEIAIEAARRAGMRLLIAGKVDAVDGDYFQSRVAPLIDGEQVVFLGEADGRMKRELYRDARCLLAPIVWEEPFGLVMAEAQACGTPVIAFRRGAAPEIVRDGETGFLADDAEGMVEAIRRTGEINPRDCRRWAEQKFDTPRMADDYLRLYETVLAEKRRALPQPSAVLPVVQHAASTSADVVA